jgi:hypothetical protein
VRPYVGSNLAWLRDVPDGNFAFVIAGGEERTVGREGQRGGGLAS